MSREKRIFKKNTYYHIFNRGNNKERIFKYPEDKQFFISLLYKYRKGTDLGIDRYSVMDNHYHLILRVGNHPELVTKFMQKIGTSYAVYVNKKYDRVGYVFQGRYKANILIYKKDLLQARNYVAQNAVKEGYVKNVKDYPWSKSE
jgi:REP element-mobilizing transposase RayT